MLCKFLQRIAKKNYLFIKPSNFFSTFALRRITRGSSLESSRSFIPFDNHHHRFQNLPTWVEFVHHALGKIRGVMKIKDHRHLLHSVLQLCLLETLAECISGSFEKNRQCLAKKISQGKMSYVISKFLSTRDRMTFIHFLEQRSPRRCRSPLSPRDRRCWRHRVPAPGCTRRWASSASTAARLRRPSPCRNTYHKRHRTCL